MSDDPNTEHEQIPWPQSGDKLFVSTEGAENAWLKWRGDDKWFAYAEGYRKAADLLAKQSSIDSSEIDFLVYPIGFLYRHYLELRLKSLIIVGLEVLGKRHEFRKNHDIEELWKKTRAVLQEVWPNGSKTDLDNVDACIHEFAHTDPISEAFRYPTTKDGKQTLANLKHIDLANLSKVMERLSGLLDSALDGMLEMLSTKCEAGDHLGY